jgi:PAS domain-containing protein
VEYDWPVLAATSLTSVLATVAIVFLFQRLRSAMTGGRSGNAALVELALNNLTQGVAMFDATGCLVVCNERYLAIYALPGDIVKPGARLADIIRLRAKSGSLPCDPDKYCATSWR